MVLGFRALGFRLFPMVPFEASLKGYPSVFL